MVLCLFLVLSVFLTSCRSNNNDSNTSTDNTITSGTQSNAPGWDAEKNRWISSLDPNKYKGQNKQFKVLIMGSSYGTYSSREFTFSEDSVLLSEVINDAAGKKNEYIEDHYGVKIVPVYAENVSGSSIIDLIRAEINSNSGAYDAIMPYFSTLTTFAAEGSLVDLSDTNFGGTGLDLTQTLDFSKPWWDKTSITDLAIRDKVFFVAGDITLLNKVLTRAVVFNKDLIAKYDLESPYDLVDDGIWTFDKMYEMALKNVSDSDGDGLMTHTDNWGMITAYGDLVDFYFGSGYNFAKLDSNKEPILTVNGTAEVGVINKILEKLNDRSWHIPTEECGFETSEMWDKALAIFGEGRAMFRMGSFSAVEKLKMRHTANYGIVPLPKMSPEQDRYYSYVSAGAVSGISMLNSTPDVEFSAYMIEVNAVEGKNYLTPAYYELVLKKQAAQDPESVRMLDLVFDTIYYDLGGVYNFGNIHTVLNGLVRDKSMEVVSSLDAIKQTAEESMRKLVEKFDEM